MTLVVFFLLLITSPEIDNKWQNQDLTVEQVTDLTSLEELLPSDLQRDSIESFDCALTHPTSAGQIQHFTIKGRTFSDEMVAALQQCEKGTKIWLDNIKAPQPDGTMHVFNISIRVI